MIVFFDICQTTFPLPSLTLTSSIIVEFNLILMLYRLSRNRLHMMLDENYRDYTYFRMIIR